MDCREKQKTRRVILHVSVTDITLFGRLNRSIDLIGFFFQLKRANTVIAATDEDSHICETRGRTPVN